MRVRKHMFATKIMVLRLLLTEMNKKGVSAIIATVGIILLTFAAAALLIGFVVPWVQKSLNGASECVGYEDYFTFEEEYGYNCQNGTEFWISVRAKTGDNETRDNVNGMKISFEFIGERESIDVEKGNNLNGARMLNGSLALSLPESGEVKTYIYNATRNYTSAELYPVLKSGRVCGVSDRINLERYC